ncbi:MAG: hypothetical protein AB7P99_01795 [Vicinamibacterales bacterium]
MRISRLPTILAATLAVSMSACSIDVGEDVDGRDTGLPNYPGARLVQEGDRPESARVNIDTSFFGLGVVAAEFETDDAPAAVIAFYREAMQEYGPVLECRGDVQFKDDRAVCEPEPTSNEVQLVAGREADQRIVAVKPRGAGSEFAMVHVRTRGEEQ